MAQEEKQLLLKDLCARLPYTLIGTYSWKGNAPFERELTGELYSELSLSWGSTCDSEFTPYLRPMSSMTDEEYKEYDKALELDCSISANVLKTNLEAKKRVLISTWYNGTDWLNAHHFDYRGLIEKGLALEAPEGMYKTE